jgi:DNA-binding transcriptional LysR family regulator
MSLRALRTLTVIARRGSFSAAAEEVGLTQAAVSLQMKSLEEELDAELFDRTGRSPRLNAAGRLVLKRAEEILSLFDGLQDELDPDKAVGGVLVVGVIPTALTGPVPKALARLKRQHADLQVRVRSGISDHLAPLVEDGELDAALISEPPYAIPTACEWRPYDIEPFYVVGPRTAEPQDAQALFEHLPFIRFDKTAWTGAMVEGHLMARGVHPPEVVELDSLEAVLSLVEVGLGFGIAPFNAARLDVAKQRFSVSPLGSPQLQRRVGLYQRSRHPRRAFTEALFEALCEECKYKK